MPELTTAQPDAPQTYPTSQDWPSPLNDAAYHGLAGEFVHRIEPETEADPAALLICFLVAFGNIVGHHVYCLADGARHYLNLFAVLVGATSKGRKGTTWARIIERLLFVAKNWHEHVTGGLSSGEGLIWQIRDPIYGIVKNKKTKVIMTTLVDAGVADKRLMCVEAEFATVLSSMQRRGNTLSEIIRKSWESGTLRALTKNSPAKATNAHVSIIGHISRDELRRYLDRSEAASGFGNRFLWICAKRSKTLPEGGHLDDETFADLNQQIADALEFANEDRLIRRADDARRLWADIYPELSEEKPGMVGALTARGEAQVLRLAAVYAVLDCSTVVCVEHLQAAIALWEYCEESVRWCFGDASGDPIGDTILESLRSCGGQGMSRTQISALFGRHIEADRLTRIIRTGPFLRLLDALTYVCVKS